MASRRREKEMRFGRKGMRIFWSEVRALRLKTGDLDNDLNHIQ